MVILTLYNKINGLIGPVMMRSAIKARHRITGGLSVDRPYLDMMLLLPHAQKIISLEVYDRSIKAVSKFKEQERMGSASKEALASIFSGEGEMKNKKISDLRVSVLEENLRPALIVNEKWSDVLKWRLNPRLLKWARSELLISKYGPYIKEGLDAYPQLRSSLQLSRSPALNRLFFTVMGGRGFDAGSDKKFVLPSTETVMKAFQMTNWKTAKNTKRALRSMEKISKKIGGKVAESNGSMHNFADIPADADLSSLSIEEVLELAGGFVVNCGAFNALCEEANIFQMWTDEYISTLGRYLLDRSLGFGGKTTVLDVGAGDGLLAKFLNEYMESELKREAKRMKKNGSKKGKKLRSPRVVATDNGSWGIFSRGDVERLSVEESITKYSQSAADKGESDSRKRQKRHQLIVLCSWMPMGDDWTENFRKNGVDEYILIGEADDGTCGDNWKTWGNPSFIPIEEQELVLIDREEDVGKKNQETRSARSGELTPPYSADGYVRWDIDELAPFQLSRFDCAESRFSKTVSFRKLR